MIPVVKAFILTSLVALSQAYAIYNYPHYANTGTSQQYNSQDGIGNYQFGYNEDHSSGGTFRKETGDAWGNKYGSYGLRDADGRYRVVNYVADQAGFRAAVKTNEPGVAPEDPASATINKPESFISAPIKTVSKNHCFMLQTFTMQHLQNFHCYTRHMHHLVTTKEPLTPRVLIFQLKEVHTTSMGIMFTHEN
ncbi:cuticle protein 14 isoform b [Caerostris extrusa]|uniref:Cuticle protein 14 isoform b n=1 Tax=Caerostris extrusa TaxID=172846 RepID=A0AAV4NTU4_CAEEX|nr:cuticle protein 14 isoform b [Caerostris extrusa]